MPFKGNGERLRRPAGLTLTGRGRGWIDSDVPNPDLINFDSNKSYGDPAYLALKMFKNNLADRVLSLKLTYSGAKGYKAAGAGRGMVAFTNPSADCRYKDIRRDH